MLLEDHPKCYREVGVETTQLKGQNSQIQSSLYQATSGWGPKDHLFFMGSRLWAQHLFLLSVLLPSRHLVMYACWGYHRWGMSREGATLGCLPARIPASGVCAVPVIMWPEPAHVCPVQVELCACRGFLTSGAWLNIHLVRLICALGLPACPSGAACCQELCGASMPCAGCPRGCELGAPGL